MMSRRGSALMRSMDEMAATSAANRELADPFIDAFYSVPRHQRRQLVWVVSPKVAMQLANSELGVYGYPKTILGRPLVTSSDVDGFTFKFRPVHKPKRRAS